MAEIVEAEHLEVSCSSCRWPEDPPVEVAPTEQLRSGDGKSQPVRLSLALAAAVRPCMAARPSVLVPCPSAGSDERSDILLAFKRDS